MTIFVDMISLRKLVDRECHADIDSTAIRWNAPAASNPDGPYRAIEIVADISQLCATIDDSATLKSRNAIRALT
jgi:hypothetical protein